MRNLVMDNIDAHTLHHMRMMIGDFATCATCTAKADKARAERLKLAIDTFQQIIDGFTAVGISTRMLGVLIVTEKLDTVTLDNARDLFQVADQAMRVWQRDADEAEQKCVNARSDRDTLAYQLDKFECRAIALAMAGLAALLIGCSASNQWGNALSESVREYAVLREKSLTASTWEFRLPDALTQAGPVLYNTAAA